MKKLLLSATILAALGVSAAALAADDVKIGALLPLTGNAASARRPAEAAAMELAVDIVNNAHPDLPPCRWPRARACPTWAGARSELVARRPAGQPVGRPEPGAAPDHAGERRRALRRLPVGRHPDHQRGGRALRQAVPDRRLGRPRPDRARLQVVLPHHADRRPTSPASTWTSSRTRSPRACGRQDRHRQRELGIRHLDRRHDHGRGQEPRHARSTSSISYAANSADVSSQVLQLKQENPDVVIFISYTSDAILYMRTMQAQGYKPTILIGDDSGFSDPSFIQTVGDISPGRHQPQRLRRQQGGQQLGQGQRAVQGEDRPRHRRHQRRA